MERTFKGRLRKIISLVLVLMMVIPFSLFELGTTSSALQPPSKYSNFDYYVTGSEISSGSGWYGYAWSPSVYSSYGNASGTWDGYGLWAEHFGINGKSYSSNWDFLDASMCVQAVANVSAPAGNNVTYATNHTYRHAMHEASIQFTPQAYAGWGSPYYPRCMSVAFLDKPISGAPGGLNSGVSYDNNYWYGFRSVVPAGAKGIVISMCNTSNANVETSLYNYVRVFVYDGNQSSPINSQAVYYAIDKNFGWASNVSTTFSIEKVASRGYCIKINGIDITNGDFSSSGALNLSAYTSIFTDAAIFYPSVGAFGCGANGGANFSLQKVCGENPIDYRGSCDHPSWVTTSTAYLRSAATCTAKATYWKTCSACGASAQGIDNNQYFESGSTTSHNTSGSIYTTSNSKPSSTSAGVNPANYCVGQTLYKWTYCTSCNSNISNSSTATTGTHAHAASSTWSDKSNHEAQCCTYCGAEINRRIKITYNANTGSGAPSTTYSNSTTGTSYSGTLSATVPTLSGYGFKGWSTTQYAVDSGTATYQPGGNFSGFSANTTLYAVWGKEIYTDYYFMPNNSTQLEHHTYTKGDSTTGYTVPSSLYNSADGKYYIDLKWSGRSAGSNTEQWVYTGGDRFNANPNPTTSSNRNFYVRSYTPAFRIEYNANGGYWDGVSDTANKTPAYAYTTEGLTTKHAGYLVVGDRYVWPEETDTLTRPGYRLHTSIDCLNIVRFYTANGSGTGITYSGDRNYGYDIWPYNTSTLAGQAGLNGYSRSNDGANINFDVYNSTTAPNGTATLYAVWDPIITYNLNDNTGRTVQDFNYITGSEHAGLSNNQYTILGVGGMTMYNTKDSRYNGRTTNSTEGLRTNRDGITANDLLKIPERSGYTLLGWATSQERANSNTVDYAVGATPDVTAPLNLWAVWSAGKTVTLHSGYNGNGHNHSLTVTNGSTVTLYNDKSSVNSNYGIAPNSSNPNAVLRGWNTNENGTGTWYTTLDNTSGNLAVTDLYAMWEYPVIWDANGGTFKSSFAAGSPSTITTYTRIGGNEDQGALVVGGKTWNYGQSFLDEGYSAFPTANDLYREGYTAFTASGTPFFLLYGYHPNATFGDNQVGRIYTQEGAGQWFTSTGFTYFYTNHLYPETNGVITMYAVWLPDITFNANGGSGTMAKQNPDVEWRIDGMLTVNQIRNGATNKAFTTSNGQTYYNPYYKAFTAPSNGFTAPAGMRFAGWNDNEAAADRGEVKWTAGAQVFGAGYAVDTGAAPKTLYAVWVPNTVQVSFKSEDGLTLLQKSDVTIGTAASYTGVTPTKAPTAQYTYTFGGWYTEPNGGGTLATLTNIQSNMTVYAHFTETVRTYTVTVTTNNAAWGNVNKNGMATDYSGGRETYVVNNVPYGHYLIKGINTLNVCPTAENVNAIEKVKYFENTGSDKYDYKFVGWYIGNTKITASAQVTGDVTVVATFEETPKEFTITYELNYNKAYTVPSGYYAGRVIDPEADWYNASGIAETYTYSTTQAVELPQAVNITCKTCKFMGWYENASFTGAPVTAIPAGSTGNKTFYAKWAPYTLYVRGQAFNLTVGGEDLGEFTNKHNEPVDVPGTAVALNYTGTDHFCCWVNGTGKLLGTSKALDYTFYSVTLIEAIHTSKDDNNTGYKYVAFMSDERDVYKANIYDTIEATDIPDVSGYDIPTKIGWTLMGWTLDSSEDRAVDANIVASINAKIAEGKDSVIMVFPVFVENEQSYYVKVYDGGHEMPTVTKAIGDICGMHAMNSNFSYWTDGNNNIVSYNPYFYVRHFKAGQTYTYKAVFGETVTNPTIIVTDPEPYVTPADGGKNRYSFTVSISAPVGQTMKEMGILYTGKTAASTDEALRLDMPNVSKYKSESPGKTLIDDEFVDSGTVTINLITGASNGTFHVRGYAIASDGETVVYGNIIHKALGSGNN